MIKYPKRKPMGLSQALKVIRQWLGKLGYLLTLDPDTSSFPEGQQRRMSHQ